MTDDSAPTWAVRANAVAHLGRVGWIQRRYAATRNDGGACCLVESIGRGAGLPPLALTGDRPKQHIRDTYPEQLRAAEATIGVVAAELGRPKSTSISAQDWLANWNDHKERTFPQVVEALMGDHILEILAGAHA
ncbi:hypothetical protein ACIBH1_45450 [Nonomuraea sp. NPDC050663]|uniref:DUF6197 family protein n=1 Tax=Nonomuraea sp. NPDC050663 TaxID=3364370 RepID=UPI0037B3D211